MPRRRPLAPVRRPCNPAPISIGLVLAAAAFVAAPEALRALALGHTEPVPTRPVAYRAPQSQPDAPRAEPAPEPAPEPPPAPANGPESSDTGSPAERPPPATEPEGPTEAIVLLKSGRTVTGLLIDEDAAGLTLRIAGLDQRFRSRDIERIERLAPVLERYRRMRRVIGDDDLDRLMDLAGWLRDRERYRLALREVEYVLAVDPQYPGAESLRVLLDQQIELLRKSGRPAGEPGNRTEPDEPEAMIGDGRGRPQPPGVFPLLNEHQVNLMRVYEIDLSDPGRVLIPRHVVEELLDRYRGEPGVPLSREDRNALFAAPPADILALMFSLQARELYGRVQVLEHPKAIQDFTDNVHRTWLQNSCASNRCHGGAEAGRFRLATRRPNAPETVYTNLLILDRYRIRTENAPNGVPLIDYERPERSPLLQMGLPEDVSLFAHPPLTGKAARRFRPIFRSMDDRRFRQATEWIRGMHQPRPDYPIDYTPPAPASPVDPELRHTPVPR